LLQLNNYYNYSIINYIGIQVLAAGNGTREDAGLAICPAGKFALELDDTLVDGAAGAGDGGDGGGGSDDDDLRSGRRRLLLLAAGGGGAGGGGGEAGGGGRGGGGAGGGGGNCQICPAGKHQAYPHEKYCDDCAAGR
jgi:hypothetical protein